MTPAKLPCLVALLVLAGIPYARGFDYARYQPIDLDAVLDQRRSATGVDLYPALPLRIRVTLTSYAEPCVVEFLKESMIAAGLRQFVESVPVTSCIKVRSAKNRASQLFIQDKVAELLPKEVPLGSPVTLFAIHLFTTPDVPGLLVNEFSADDVGSPGQAGTQPDQKAAIEVPGCGCGTAGNHVGNDYAVAEGTPVMPLDEGIVVKVEQNEQAVVNVPNAGRCGRYVVIKHSYPNGRIAFTRYAQLGSIVGSNGKALAVGTRVTKKDKIGQIGSQKTMHFEVWPGEPTTMNVSASWQRRFGSDPTMDWSRYRPVNPETFDPDVFGGPRKTVQAADKPGAPSTPALKDLRGEWVRNGPSFACKVDSPKQLPPEALKPDLLFLPCLRIGALGLGTDASTLSVLGAVQRTVPQPKGATASFYFPEGPGRYPYLVATVLKDRIIALQITGPTASKSFNFNHIDLGSTSETVIQYFGPPQTKGPNGQPDTELWSYGSWPFSFEVKDGRVVSIRIAISPD